MKEEYKHTYCRLCLCKLLEQSEAVHLMGAVGKDNQGSKNLLDIVNRFLPVRLKDVDGLSAYICLFCHDRIKDFDKYVEIVMQNQLELARQQPDLAEDEKQPNWEVKVEVLEDNMNIALGNDAEDDNLPADDDFSFEKFGQSFSCEVCSQLLPTKAGLTMHMRFKHKIVKGEPSTRPKRSQKLKIASNEQGQGDYHCDLCQLTFKSKTQIESHMEQSHSTEGESFHCPTCSKTFTHKTQLKLHRRTHNRQKKVNDNAQAIAKYLKCEICDNQVHFTTFVDLITHFQTEHNTKGYVRCCERQFFTRKSVVNHENQHSRPTDFMCSICGKLLPNQYSLRDHVARHGADSEKKHVCTVCDKKFHLRYDLTDHVRRKHSEKKEEEAAVCEICNKNFASKISLYLHNRRFHTHVQFHVCEICGKSCRSKGDLNSHIKHRHMEMEKQKCETCGAFVKNMQKHLQIHFESTLNIQCQICGHKTTTFKYLKLHMKIHTDDKPFQCAQCGQSFKRKKALDDHTSIHNGIPRHFCNYCDRTFNNSGNKFKHIKQAHPLEAAMNRKRTRIIPGDVAIVKVTPDINPGVHL